MTCRADSTRARDPRSPIGRRRRRASDALAPGDVITVGDARRHGARGRSRAGHKIALARDRDGRRGAQVRMCRSVRLTAPIDGGRLDPLAQPQDAARGHARVRVRADRRRATRAPAPAADVQGLPARRRPRRHAQRDVGAQHRRLRQSRRRADRQAGERAVRRACRRRSRVRASVRLQPARRRSREHSGGARRPDAASERRRRARARTRLREQPARRAAAPRRATIDRRPHSRSSTRRT